MTGARDIYFHIGVHKTATTHLQRVLGGNRKTIAAAGIDYIGPAHTRAARVSILELLGIAHQKWRPSPHLPDLKPGAERILISEENYIGSFHRPELAPGFYPQAEERLRFLKSRLGDHRLHLAIGVRDPASFITSHYCQSLLAQQVQSWDEFIANMPLTSFDWFRWLRALAAPRIFTSITVWPYEEYGLVQDKIFSHLLGTDMPGLKIERDRIFHQGLSEHAVNWVLGKSARGKSGPLAARGRRRYPISEEFPRFEPWGEDLLMESAVRYSKMLHRVRQLPGVTLLVADN